MAAIDAQFVAAARGWIGVPWAHQGRSRAGVDCIGLVVMAGRDCGFAVPIEATYGMTQAYSLAKPLLAQWCEREGGGAEGRIALFMNSATLHVGILTAEGTVIHSLATVGRVVESGVNFEIRQWWRPKWPC